MNPHLSLALAIVCEVFATSCLKASDGFNRLVPTALSIVGYIISFYLLSQTLKSMPTGVVYAIWSGVGIVFISLIGWLFFKQTLDLAAIIGMGLIMLGVIVINLFSKTTGH